MTEEQKSYLRGKRYQEEKKEHGGHKKKGQGPTGGPCSGKTADMLAQEYGVNKSTIHNDTKFAQAVGTVAAKGGEEVKQAVLSGKVTKKEVLKMAGTAAAKWVEELRQEVAAAQTKTGKKKEHKDLFDSITCTNAAV